MISFGLIISFVLLQTSFNFSLYLPESDFSILPIYGEPFLMPESVAALTNNSLMWNSNGVEYYLVSDALSQMELVEIANSISAIPTMK